MRLGGTTSMNMGGKLGGEARRDYQHEYGRQARG